MPSKIQNVLQRCSTLWFVVYAASAAFMTYFCMYAFRKTFAVGSFTELDGWQYAVDFKTALILSQVLGYALSKFIGIKVVSEMTPGKRAFAILALVMASELALVLFAVLPGQWKLLSLFLNGLPLGMIWGLVFSFLEGRRVSEVLGAGLSISFIVSSGVVKTVGQWLMLQFNISEYWMPALTGMLFTLPLFISVFLLAQIPPPNQLDIQARNLRPPMTSADRWRFFHKYMPGLVLLILAYVLLTGIRDFSDNFAAEIWASLGFGDTPGIFSKAALLTSFIILGLISLVMLVKDNLTALMTNHGLIVLGIITIGLSTLLYQARWLAGDVWMTMLTTGIYLAYVPFNCLLFDRLLSAVNDKANAGFLIYLADAMGYAGTVGILLFKHFLNPELSWLHFLQQSAYLISIVGTLLMFGSAYFFYRRLGPRTLQVPATQNAG
ncbi:DUF5690 family protein [Bowmanella yangjiangensis]|uniref:MFS transporter n=1 Tax=Bowmanella yangjiangensis TaxID=2811230 RepID=A0ABS3CRN6_9ALTE|nr:DUF5690 family protein [Bowmanella yangjiangensis]MBN7819773.1 hypothetical protein [Bowmanella yangjiangensis]